ncbi:hypothetical protein D9758_018194 [Tetrapyrgos nigripes]|uniref:Uncharacterized protein n=1 Tax=Tetrapyrgos nigripes TaxID=182062 RepID=A0A8H5BU34_9AGAR|nr:hypothetical protein D9758_018194 [Tetrapyrgos nigripes]
MSYYIKNIYGVSSDSSHPPENCVKELNTSHPDINRGFKGKYVWLIPERANNADEAGTYIQIEITSEHHSGQQDLAQGAGGKYRYLHVLHDSNENEKITEAALYRKSNSAGPVTLEEAARAGFNRVSSDINEGRGGDFLHLIYKVSV